MRESKEQRLIRLLAFDAQFAPKQVMGFDEAGRGCLAGPIYGAAVILNPQNPISDLNDSKKIREALRYPLAEEIKQKSLAFGFGVVSAQVIDQIGIQKANFLAFQKAYEACIQKISPQHLVFLIDGNYKNIPISDYIAIPKGDTLSAAISAASILAKTERDLFMKTKMHMDFEGYGFDAHKGYGTKAHETAIIEKGLCPIHRRSFCKKFLG